MNRKIVFLAALGVIFFIMGIYSGNVSFQYLGVGTLLSGVIYITLYPGFKEISSLILGLLVLHTGVLFILKESLLNTKLLGLMIFTIGIVFVLNSGFSDYMKKRKKN